MCTRIIGIGCSLHVIGRRSLFAFGIGHILAYVAPKAWIGLFGLWGSVLVLFTLVCILTLLYDQIEQHQVFKREFGWRHTKQWLRHKPID